MTDASRYLLTETYVRDVLRLMGQPGDADNPHLVGRIAAKLLRAIDLRWAHPNSVLRLSDEELSLIRSLPKGRNYLSDEELRMIEDRRAS